MASSLEHLNEVSRSLAILKATIERRYRPDEAVDLWLGILETELILLTKSIKDKEK